MTPCGLPAGYQYTTLAIIQNHQTKIKYEISQRNEFLYKLYADAVWKICELFHKDEQRMI